MTGAYRPDLGEVPDNESATGHYRTLGPKEQVQVGDEIAWHLNDLRLPESWSVVTGSVGVYPKSFPQFVWRRRMAYERQSG